MLPLVTLIVGWLISLLCIVHLWFGRRAHWLRKVGWSVALLVPYIGPVFYGALFDALSSQPDNLRAQENSYAVSGLHHHDDR